MNFLEAVQSICLRVGVPAPNVAVQSQDPTVQQIVELLHEEGDECALRYEWRRLARNRVITATGVVTQGLVETLLPGLLTITNDAMWNATTQQKIVGSADASQWQQRMVYDTGPQPVYRIENGALMIHPAPAAGDRIYVECQSRYWLWSIASEEREFAKADTDVFLLDARLLCLGTIWRWKKTKGFEYAEDFATYERRFETLAGKDGGGRPVLSLTRRRGSPIRVTVPEGSWTV